MNPKRAEREYLRRLKKLTKEERLEIGFQLNDLALELLTGAIKRDHPKAKGNKILELAQKRTF